MRSRIRLLLPTLAVSLALAISGCGEVRQAGSAPQADPISVQMPTVEPSPAEAYPIGKLPASEPSQTRPSSQTASMIGIPNGVVPQPASANVGAAWSPSPGVLWVFTQGASNCPANVATTATEAPPWQPTSSQSLGSATVDIAISGPNPNAPCLRDLVFHTMAVEVPQSADNGGWLEVNLVPDGTPGSGESLGLLVPPRAAPGEIGPAVWASTSID